MLSTIHVLYLTVKESDVKDELINMSRAWAKKKILVSDRNRVHDLPNTGQAQGHLTEFECDRCP